ncbi:hypothetical protein R1flu_008472 [Riccia fluitans]|uniref:Uncharacterized protein n=1 Tax=Riccia fluitans TaxID=41844 RepID=A0ABD1YFD9_9MARC
MASGSRRREGKSSELPELPEEGGEVVRASRAPGGGRTHATTTTTPSSLHDMESTSRALDEEEREIESAFLGSIWGEPSSAYAGGPSRE